ncbi:MAG TPA: hypothetical protein VGI45_10475 [Terracidiphilus sp.]
MCFGNLSLHGVNPHVKRGKSDARAALAHLLQTLSTCGVTTEKRADRDPLQAELSGEKTMSQVVGVVKSGKYRTLGEAPAAAVFRGQVSPARTLVVRTAGDSRTLLNEIRREVPIVDPLMAQSSHSANARPVSTAAHRNR